MLVDSGEAGVVTSLAERLGGGCLVEGAHPGKTDPAVTNHPHTDAGRVSRGEVLDLALVDAHRRLAALCHVGLHLLALSA